MTTEAATSRRPGVARGLACRAALVAAACAAGLLTLSAAVSAEDKPAAKATEDVQTPAKKQPWTITCVGEGAEGELACAAQQTLIAKDSGQRVLTISIAKAAGDGLAATLALPHGLLLTDGVQVSIDDGERTKYAITTADQNGSYATMKLDAPLIEALKRGSILNVRVTAVTGNEIVLQLSLSGFTSAIAKL